MGKLGPNPPPPKRKKLRVNPLHTKDIARKRYWQNKLSNMQAKTKKRPVHPGRNFRVVT